MNHLPTLTKARRDEILARLTPVQRQALNQFTMYEMKSWFHTKIFQTAIDWEFQGVAIDPFYQQERSRPADSRPLFCNCGRQIKYQYIIKSRATGISKQLGISHFTQEAGIPQSVANEIMRHLNRIHIFTDSILIDYQAGKRFPKSQYFMILNRGGFNDNQHYNLYSKCIIFFEADLPLFPRDKHALDRLYGEIRNSLLTNPTTHPHLTKTIQTEIKKGLDVNIFSNQFNLLGNWHVVFADRQIVHLFRIDGQKNVKKWRRDRNRIVHLSTLHKFQATGNLRIHNCHCPYHDK